MRHVSKDLDDVGDATLVSDIRADRSSEWKRWTQVSYRFLSERESIKDYLGNKTTPDIRLLSTLVAPSLESDRKPTGATDSAANYRRDHSLCVMTGVTRKHTYPNLLVKSLMRSPMPDTGPNGHGGSFPHAAFVESNMSLCDVRDAVSDVVKVMHVKCKDIKRANQAIIKTTNTQFYFERDWVTLTIMYDVRESQERRALKKKLLERQTFRVHLGDHTIVFPLRKIIDPEYIFWENY